ncbi:MAG: hypothetical protein HFG70_10520 [Hungatella sp.]|nr:hypothetical protein [Hungatella sp.]
MKDLKKSKIILFAGCMTLLLAISGIWAFFHATSSIKNKFTTSSSEMSIVEIFDKFDKWLPGEQKVKKVSFENSGSADMLFRFKVDVSFEGSTDEIPDGMVICGWNNPYLKENFQEVTSTENGKPVTYYYYKKVFGKKDATEDVMEYVEFADDITKAYQGRQVNVTVTGEMVQLSENGAAAKDKGWAYYKQNPNGDVEWDEFWPEA